MAKGLRKATKKATYESRVAQLDSLGQDLDSFVKQEGMTILEQALGDFIERVTENINNEKNLVTTGDIADISLQAEGGLINVMANAHLIYQDRGVNGAMKKLYSTPHSYKDKRPPVEAIKKWVKTKQAFLTDDNDNKRKYDDRLTDAEKSESRPFKELTQEEKVERAAWAISTKVFNEGFRPRNLYSKEIPKLVEDIQAVLGDFVLQQINQQIDIRPREGGGNRIV